MNLGLIGTNFISDTLVDAASGFENITVHSIYSRKMSTGLEFAAKYGIKNVFDDLETFLSDDKLDAVYIASPNSCHCDQAVAALKKKKHVLVEKPAASNCDELALMKKAAEENHVVLMEAMRAAYLPGYQWIRDRLPLIGTVRSAQFQFCQYSRRYDKFKAGEILNAFNPALSNAAVMDIGVYALHLFLMLFGRPDGIKAASVLLPNGMEGTGTAVLSYPKMVGSVTWSKITDGIAPSVIQGEMGSIAIDHLTQTKKITLILRNGETEKYIYDGPENSMQYELAVFEQLVSKKNSDPKCDASDILKTTKLCLEVMDEIRRQTGVKFPADNW